MDKLKSRKCNSDALKISYCFVYYNTPLGVYLGRFTLYRTEIEYFNSNYRYPFDEKINYISCDFSLII